MRSLKIKPTLLIVLASLIFLWLIKTPILSVYLSHQVRIPLSMERVSLWPTVTKIRGFTVKNPKGFLGKSALHAKTVEIDYAIKQLASSPRVIEKIILDEVTIDVELTNESGSRNNWTAILTEMPKRVRHTKISIQTFLCTNLTVHIHGFGPSGELTTKTVSQLELNDINSATGFPTEEVVQQLFGNLGLGQFIEDILNPEKDIETILTPLKVL